MIYSMNTDNIYLKLECGVIQGFIILVSSRRLKAEEDQLKKDDDKARKEYIKYEYLRRKQLKLMEDMDDVIKPRTGSLKKKPRPKSIHRDVVESAPPVRATGEYHKHISCKHTRIWVTATDLCLCCRGASSRILSIKCFFGISQSG